MNLLRCFCHFCVLYRPINQDCVVGFQQKASQLLNQKAEISQRLTKAHYLNSMAYANEIGFCRKQSSKLKFPRLPSSDCVMNDSVKADFTQALLSLIRILKYSQTKSGLS